MSCCSKTVSLDFLHQCLCMDMTWAYRNPVWKPTYLLDTHAHILLQGFLFMEKLVPLCVSLTFSKVQRSSAGSSDCQTKCDSDSLSAKCCEKCTFTLTPIPILPIKMALIHRLDCTGIWVSRPVCLKAKQPERERERRVRARRFLCLKLQCVSIYHRSCVTITVASIIINMSCVDVLLWHK